MQQNVHIPIFGVPDYDEYWRGRKNRNRAGKTYVHDLLIKAATEYTPAGGSILDLGVGPGHVFKELRQHGFDMHGVEISDEARALYDFPIDTIVQHDLQQGIPALDAAPFDTIIASYITHHMRDPKTFLQQIHAALKNNGHLILVTQNISFITYRLRYILCGEFPRVSDRHINFISPYEYKRLLSSVGFELTALRTTGSHTILKRLFPGWFGATLFFICQKKNVLA